MELALALSRKGWGQCAPNPTVGAVIVRYSENSSTIVGRGWTKPSGRPHAERVALEQAGPAAKGATVYVTLEPCSHHGKSPPCADALIEYGVSRVVYAAFDPDSRVSGRGLQRLKDAGIQVEQAPEEQVRKAEWIMKGHMLRQTDQRPFVQVKLGIDAEYKVSKGDGAPVWITGEESRTKAHLLRAQADAILIGRGTAQADNPTLTCRLPGMYNRSPIRVLLDKALQIPVTHSLFESVEDVPLWICCDQEADQSKMAERETAGAQILKCKLSAETGTLSIPSVLEKLAEQGITRLMVEGGPTVVASFWQSRLIDELVLFQSTRKLGEQGAEAVSGIGLEAVLNDPDCNLVMQRSVGSDTMKTYRIG